MTDATAYVCQNCGEAYDWWQEECDNCGESDTILEEDEDSDDSTYSSTTTERPVTSQPGGTEMAYGDDVDVLFERAKAAYRREREREQDRIRQDEKHAYDWTQGVIGFLTAIVNAFTAVWNAACYITTAVTRHLGLPDDCHYLTVLRQFRQSYILDAGVQARIEDLRYYDQVAPEIVSIVEARADAEAIWATLTSTIIAAVREIECGRQSEAYNIYKTKILSLRADLTAGGEHGS